MRKEIVHLREKEKANGIIGFYLDYFVNGKRKYESLIGIDLYKNPRKRNEKEHNKEKQLLALKIRNSREQDIIANRFGETINYSPKASFIKFFELLAEEKDNHKSTQSVWYSALKHLINYAPNTQMMDINENWQEGFKNYLLKMVSQNSAHSYNNKIRTAIKESLRRKLVPNINLVKGIKYQEVEIQYLTEDELRRLFDTECDTDVLKRAFLFSCLTGLRWSDINNLKWSNVEKDNNVVYLSFKQQKTKWVERMPVSKEATSLFDKKPNNSERVFKGLKYSVWYNMRLCKWILKASITKHITFHCARHTNAYLLLKNGNDIYAVSKMLGHKDIKSTLVYAKFADEMKLKAATSLPNFIF